MINQSDNVQIGDYPSTIIPKKDSATDDALKIEVLLKAAELHLDRAINLSKTEWTVSVLFWGALLTSGISFIAFSANSAPPLAEYIAHNDWIIMVAYCLAGAVFIFGFSVNQATSIKEERSQYQKCINEAAGIVGIKSRARTGRKDPDVNEVITISTFFTSKVWTTKLLSTYLFISAIWICSQVLAHGKVAIYGRAGEAAKKDPNLWCAFFDCHSDNVVNISGSPFNWDFPEVGTISWTIGFVAVSIIWSRSLMKGRR